MAMRDSSTSAPLVGILGGMGPAATVDFYSKLIAATPAAIDQEHLRVMIWSDPSVPDRSHAIRGTGEDPTPALIHGARQLKDSGADFFVVTCNGAHAFMPRVLEEVDLEFISIVDTTTRHISDLPYVTSAGILATDATLASALYQNSLGEGAIEPIVPSTDQQRIVMETIYAVKAGGVTYEQKQALGGVVMDLVDRGADVIVAGCTEVPLAMRPEESPRQLIDPSLLLANEVVRRVTDLRG